MVRVDRLVAGAEHVRRRDRRTRCPHRLRERGHRLCAEPGDRRLRRRRAGIRHRTRRRRRAGSIVNVPSSLPCMHACRAVDSGGSAPSGSITDSPASRANAVRYTRWATIRSAGCGIGDHGAAVAVADEHHVRQRQPVEHGARRGRRRRGGRRAGARRRRDRAGRSAKEPTPLVERRLQGRPAPGAVPRSVHEDDRPAAPEVRVHRPIVSGTAGPANTLRRHGHGEHARSRAARSFRPTACRCSTTARRRRARRRTRWRGRPRTSPGSWPSRAAPSPPGTTISALTSSTPTTRIEITTVHAVSTASNRFSAITGRPLARANSSSLLTVNSAGPSQIVTARIAAASTENVIRSAVDVVRDAAEQVLVQVARPGRRPADEHDTAGDAAVEEHGQRDLAERLAPGADQLDRDRSGDRGHERDEQAEPARRRARGRRPVTAMWPRPSPISASRRCTRKMPTAGALRPISIAASSARRMKS